jgi:single-strand DNA-binding protein
MAGLNKIMVIGHLGTDPEMRYTPNGYPVTSFRLATSRSYTPQDGERREETEWFTVKAWNQLGERANQYLSKGRQVYVEGRLQSHTYQGNDGQTRFANEIVASEVIFLDRSGPGQQSGEGYSGGAADDFDPAEASTPDDLPF